MKTILLIILLLNSLTVGAFSPEEFVCKKQYEDKFDRMEKHRILRMVGRGAGVLSAGVGTLLTGGALLGPYYYFSCLLIAGLIPPVAAGIGADSIYQVLDKEESLYRTYDTVFLSMIPLKKLQDDFYERKIENIIKQENSRRSQIGLTFLNESEIALIRQHTPYGNYKLTIINDMLKYFQLEETPQNYEALRIKISNLAKTDVLCPTKHDKKRPISFEKLLKLLNI